MLLIDSMVVSLAMKTGLPRLTLGALILGVAAFAQDPNAIFLPASLSADRALAQRGDVTASIRLGYRFLTGTAGTIDPVQAYQLFSSVATKSPAAAAWMGFVAATAPELAGKGVDAVGLVRQASNSGDRVGAALLGRLYHHGNGVPQDMNVAKQLYVNAAPNFALAQRYLAELYLESPNPGDHAKALPFVLTGQAVGDTGSMVLLSVMYTRGDGVTKDYTAASRWLEIAAQRQDPVAMYQRGLLYARGHGPQKSYEMAAELFQRAASAGYAPAQAALGVCYATGRGVQRDRNQAIRWLTLAAPRDAYAATELSLFQRGMRIQ